MTRVSQRPCSTWPSAPTKTCRRPTRTQKSRPNLPVRRSARRPRRPGTVCCRCFRAVEPRALATSHAGAANPLCRLCPLAPDLLADRLACPTKLEGAEELATPGSPAAARAGQHGPSPCLSLSCAARRGRQFQLQTWLFQLQTWLFQLQTWL